jgi:hypothetical protein
LVGLDVAIERATERTPDQHRYYVLRGEEVAASRYADHSHLTSRHFVPLAQRILNSPATAAR